MITKYRSVTDWAQSFADWTDYFAFREKATTSRPYNRYYLWLFAAVVVASVLVLFARTPEMLLDPRFYAEDGRIFYQDAYNLGPFRSIAIPYAGYYHLLPRLIASTSLLLSIAHVPLFYSLAALIITGIALSWFFLPHFRPFVANDWIRLGVVALCLTSPNLEALMVIAYMQWYVAAWCVLVVLMKPPRRRWIQWLIALAYVVATATAPVVLLLTPIWLLRLYHAQHAQRLWIGCILLAQVVVLWLTLSASLGAPMLIELDLLMLDLWRAFVYKVVGVTFVGHVAVGQILQSLGWRALYVLTGIVCVAVGLIMVRRRNEQKHLFLSVVLVFVILATTLLYAYRASYFGYTFARLNDFVPRWHARYFFLSSVGLYLFFALHADYLVRHKDTVAVRSTLVGCFLLVLIGQAATFRMPSLGIGNWQRYGAWLTVMLEEPPDMLLNVVMQPNVTGQEGREQEKEGFRIFLPVVTGPDQVPDLRQHVAVPIPPLPWCLSLAYTSSSLVELQFPHSFSLVAAQADLQPDHLLLDFLWTRPESTLQNDQTIWFELVDAENHVVLRQPDDLAAPAEEHCFPRLFASRHLIPLPAHIPGGVYDLSISLTDPDAPATSAAVTARFPGLVRVDR